MTASQSTHLVYFIHFPAVIHRVKSEVINSTQWSCWSNNSNFKNGAIICFLTAMQMWQFKQHTAIINHAYKNASKQAKKFTQEKYSKAKCLTLSIRNTEYTANHDFAVKR